MKNLFTKENGALEDTERGASNIVLFLILLAAVIVVLVLLIGNEPDVGDELPIDGDTTTDELSDDSDFTADAEVGVGTNIANEDDLSTMANAIMTAELSGTLDDEDAEAITVFAPSDDAFDDLPDGAMDALLAEGNQESLEAVMQHHVVSGNFTVEDLEDDQELETLSGETLTVTNVQAGTSTDELGFTLNDSAEAETVDLEASNGTIHVIDTVLIPETVDLDALISAQEDETGTSTDEPIAQ